MPENSIPGMLVAIDSGVTTLEMDVVVSADSVVLLSHEPWLSAEICRAPDGGPIDPSREKEWNIYQMDYRLIRACDCGLKPHPRFPEQAKVPAHKPALREVFEEVAEHARLRSLPMPDFNIEIKSTPQGDGVFHPKPEDYVRLVFDVVKEAGLVEKLVIQSFDERSLRAASVLSPKPRLALLVEGDSHFSAKVEQLGFIPDIYSPSSELVSAELVEFCKQKKMKLIPWTVNDPLEAARLIELGVDGLITDYPGRVGQNLVRKND
jgi:glycerophosphoryl diester phosphodiesterase